MKFKTGERLFSVPQNTTTSKQAYFIDFILQVQYILGMCTCPSQFPMIKVSDGKYKVGDSENLIFMRVSKTTYIFILLCSISLCIFLFQ